MFKDCENMKTDYLINALHKVNPTTHVRFGNKDPNQVWGESDYGF